MEKTAQVLGYRKTSSPPGSILGAPQCQHHVAGAWIVGGFSGFPSPSRAFPEMKSLEIPVPPSQHPLPLTICT